ncbi:hypothetical protein RAC89_29215 [Paenibacillus sp. GD4]|jgi:hypothetical protein|uniref:hypothetical protein n=1 Tax=Paenibacillus sp. GD4 TaxID=3068890 RepID=UPI00279653E2|nr:hypothetical protein [Paenibacillus sp. GD4]MDQ1914462.1 hypothetical protein [Paenibacillus sp. GD4]
MMQDDGIMDVQQSIPCPNCGRTMRLNYVLWKEPRYVCESFRQGKDCEMVLMLKEYRPNFDRSASAS